MVILEEDLLKKHLVRTWYILDNEHLLCAQHPRLRARHVFPTPYLPHSETNVVNNSILTLQAWTLRPRGNKYLI